MPFTPIETQEQLDAVIKERIERKVARPNGLVATTLNVRKLYYPRSKAKPPEGSTAWDSIRHHAFAK